jgi:hypothetical protein
MTPIDATPEHGTDSRVSSTDHHPDIHFTVDGEPCTAHVREMTPNRIIREFGGKDPATTYLVEIHGHERTNFEGRGDVPIELRDGEKFQCVSKGPTPVSDHADADRN